MPRFPKFADRLDALSGSVFEKFLPKMREKGDDMIKLHIGDSYLPPPYSLPIDEKFRQAHPYFNRYCNTLGIAELRQALAEKLSADNHLPAKSGDIMMTCGASNALNVSMMSLVNPGEEVLVLTPCWPFFLGMVRVAGGTPVEIPFYTRLYENPSLNIFEYIEPFVTPKTVALYVNSPNNPSGKVLSRAQLEQIAALAKKHRLWLISDEAYDGMTFDGHKHLSPASLPEMFAQTLSIFTFSKVYMFAGLRLGYISTTEATLKNLNKMLVHQLYSPSTLAQQMMVDPVKQRKQWSEEFVRHCHDLRDIFIHNLRVPHTVPEGAYYLFFSIKNLLNGRDYWQVVDECLDCGVSIAPGKDFGKDFGDYIRLCFAGEGPERLTIAVERLNKILD